MDEFQRDLNAEVNLINREWKDPKTKSGAIQVLTWALDLYDQHKKAGTL